MDAVGRFGGIRMKRITTDNVNEMGIVGLAHNCCYIGKDGWARYRDFDMDIDAREIAKKLLKELANQDVDFESDEDFDEWIGSCYGEDGIGTIHGLIAMFYQNIWAMAELRENLKRYEDLEEQGRLLVLPVRLGEKCSVRRIAEETTIVDGILQYAALVVESDKENMLMHPLNVFANREEAEAALEKMGGGEK